MPITRAKIPLRNYVNSLANGPKAYKSLDIVVAKF